jgi:hypothetical protein
VAKNEDPKQQRLEQVKALAAFLPRIVQALIGFTLHFGWRGLAGILVGAVIVLYWSTQPWYLFSSSKGRINDIWELKADEIFVVYSAKSIVRARLRGLTQISEDGSQQNAKLSGVTEAVFYLSKALPESALPKIVARAGDLDLKEFERGDVIILGGPLANIAFSTVLTKLRELNRASPYDFNSNVYSCLQSGDDTVCKLPRAIIELKGHGQTYSTTYDTLLDQSLTVQTDFGFFIIGANPFNDSKRMILMAGCHKDGTMATTSFLTDEKNKELLNVLMHDAKKKGNFLAGIIRRDKASTYFHKFA